MSPVPARTATARMPACLVKASAGWRGRSTGSWRARQAQLHRLAFCRRAGSQGPAGFSAIVTGHGVGGLGLERLQLAIGSARAGHAPRDARSAMRPTSALGRRPARRPIRQTHRDCHGCEHPQHQQVDGQEDAALSSEARGAEHDADAADDRRRLQRRILRVVVHGRGHRRRRRSRPPRPRARRDLRPRRATGAASRGGNPLRRRQRVTAGSPEPHADHRRRCARPRAISAPSACGCPTPASYSRRRRKRTEVAALEQALVERLAAL